MNSTGKACWFARGNQIFQESVRYQGGNDEHDSSDYPT